MKTNNAPVLVLDKISKSYGQVYALGGVNVKTAPELVSSGAAGFAMVDGFRT